ncbi:hypothetical protein L484_012032 [Morus notabilis]|uniref:Uncharacterized protein n=1 Tax=Morus notabilis TaxID=981085 RepID=W9RE11_9ROSA|nr:hypothetical protein L484_012032 [Morus notabilis]
MRGRKDNLPMSSQCRDVLRKITLNLARSSSRSTSQRLYHGIHRRNRNVLRQRHWKFSRG